MATQSTVPLVTDRDIEVFAALDASPLTADQLLKLSSVFVHPFTDERRVRERLHVLVEAGRVRRDGYATEGQGAPNYYRLTRLGFSLLHGESAVPTARRHFRPIGLSHQHHTKCLADFIVHLRVAAFTAGILVEGFYPENTLQLRIGEESVYPDCAFQLHAADGRAFSFFVELDNSSERIRSTKSLDAWERKLRLYDALQDQHDTRFRLLVVTTRSAIRVHHILDAARSLLRNPDRSLVYGMTLHDFLAEPTAVTTPCFQSHQGYKVTLMPSAARRRARTRRKDGAKEVALLRSPAAVPIAVPG